MYGYHTSDSNKRGDFLHSFGYSGTPAPKPVGVAVEYLGTTSGWSYYNMIVTLNKTGTGSIIVYLVYTDDEDETDWRWDQQGSEITLNPVNTSWKIEQNIRDVEMLVSGSTVWFMVCHPTVCDSQLLLWEYDFDAYYLLSGNIDFDSQGLAVVSCGGSTYNGHYDPFSGVCSGIYNYVARTYTTGRNRYLVRW